MCVCGSGTTGSPNTTAVVRRSSLGFRVLKFRVWGWGVEFRVWGEGVRELTF
jgi:hypothetical protein